MANATHVSIPPHLLPADGRFGSGPSRVRNTQMAALGRYGHTLMGTSHRKQPVRSLIADIQRELSDFFDLPEDYEVVMGNGGASAFWDVANHCLVEHRTQHVVVGDFSQKFARASQSAPFLEDPAIISSPPGTSTAPVADEDVDAYAWPHSETATGAVCSVERPDGASDDQITLVDGTSAAAGEPVNLEGIDAYYFSPQKGFGSDGGAWFALCSPRLLERAAKVKDSGRYVPGFLDFDAALANSSKNQTVNTPAIAPLILMREQLQWFNRNGGMAWAVERSAKSASILHAWVSKRPEVDFFVADASHRGNVVTTVEFDDSVDAHDVAAVLRDHGVVDVDPYRNMGRNQLRVATFPSVEPSDVEALVSCLDFVIDAVAEDR